MRFPFYLRTDQGLQWSLYIEFLFCRMCIINTNPCHMEKNKMPRPLLIFILSDYLIQVVDTNSHANWQTVQIQISWLLQWRSQLIWIYTVCKGKVYPGSAGLWLKTSSRVSGYTGWPMPNQLRQRHSADSPDQTDLLQDRIWSSAILYGASPW